MCVGVWLGVAGAVQRGAGGGDILTVCGKMRKSAIKARKFEGTLK